MTLTAKEFLTLDVAGMVRQLDLWDDGEDPEGFKTFVLDFFDNVILRFPTGSAAERWSDFILGTAGGIGFEEIASSVRRVLGFVTDAKPLAGWAAEKL